MNTLNDINSIIITDSIPSWMLFSLCIFWLSIDLIVLELIVVEIMVFLTVLVLPVNPLNKLKMEIRRKGHLVFRLRGRLARKIHHANRGTIDKADLHNEKEGNR